MTGTDDPRYGLWNRMMADSYLDAGQLRIFRFAAAVRRGEPVDPTVLQELAECFERVLFEDVEPDKALGLKMQRGGNAKRDPKDFWRRVEIAAAVLSEKRREPRRTIRAIADALVPEYYEKENFIVDCYEKHKDLAARVLAALEAPMPESVGLMLALAKDSGYGLVQINPPKRPRANR